VPKTPSTRTTYRARRRRLVVVAVSLVSIVSALLMLPSAEADDAVVDPVPGAAAPETLDPPALVTDGATWNLIFDDDFSGTSVDLARWNVPNNSNFGTGGSQDQCYLAANTTVADGALQLTGKREAVTGCGTNPDGGDSYFFTSGMVTTRRQGGSMKFKYRHGYAEVRMRVPRGNIYWPAFWLVGAGDGSSPGWPDYGEFDVSEIYGSKPDISESNFHRTGGSIGSRNHNVITKGSGGGVNINPPNAFVAGGTNDWHTYGFNWTADQLEWFIDGVLVRSYVASTDADLAALGYEHSIILNLAMGGSGPRYDGYTGQEAGDGTYDDGNLVADLPGTMQVDYVKVWQPPTAPPAVTLTTPTNGETVATTSTPFAGACTTAAGMVTVTVAGAQPSILTAPCVADEWATSGPIAEGSYSATASQTADVTGTSAPVTFTVAVPDPIDPIDPLAPVPTVEVPTAGALLGAGTTAFAGLCTDGDGPVNVTVTGSVSFSVTALCTTGTWSTSGLFGDGLYSVSVAQTDAAGNTGTSAASGFQIDGTAPVTSDDTTSVGGPWRATPATVTLTPTDTGTGVARTYYTVDGSTPDSSSPTGTSIGLTSDGVSTIRYFSVDALGNVEAVKTGAMQIRIDGTAPTNAMTFPVGNMSYNAAAWNAGCSATARICGTASDPTSGLESVRVIVQRSSDNRFWTGGGWQTSPTSVTATGSTSWSVPLPASQLTNRVTYVVTAWSADMAGNRSASTVRTFTYDTSGPTPSASNLVATNKNGAINAMADTFSVTFNEALSPDSVPSTGTLTLSRSNGSTSYRITGLTNGLRTTGAGGYLTSSSSTRTVGYAGTLGLSNGNRTVTFTVTGACTGSCSSLSTAARSGAFQYASATTLRDVAGNAPSTSAVTAAPQVLF
jgi:beta-glucanase (GH16 family)